MRKLFTTPLLTIVLLTLFSYSLSAQSLGGMLKKEKQKDPVSWTTQVEKVSDNEYNLIFKAKADPHWHFYSQYSEGTMPMAFYFDDIVGFRLVGEVSESPKPKEEYDKDLGGLTKYWDEKTPATFVQNIKITTKEKVHIHGSVEFQACINGACMPITYNFTFDLDGAKNPASIKAIESQPKEVVEPKEAVQPKEIEAPENVEKYTKEDSALAGAVAVETTNNISEDENFDEAAWKKLIWKPVKDELKAYGEENSIANKGFFIIFLLGFLGGLVALLTPCVWPMIPMTVSFFIKKDKVKGKRDAIIYGISIVAIYMILGLGVTVFAGADAMNSMATSAIFNIIFFALLVVFAISFFGAFEIQLPTKWTNKMDQKADSTSGLISIFFMAFTLVLVSFSCTGPIMGTILVEAVTKGLWGPAMGMLGFSVALALPFTLFAIFPSMMKSMPKSGGWLNSVKVVLAFIELALAFKFLSVADMAYHWHILDREVFLVLWIVIFALLGFYLLGKLTFSHDSKTEKIGVFKLFLAMISLSFALYMVPGLWGAPLKAISAFSPPIHTQDFNLYTGTVEAKFDNYEEGMAYARKNHKPVVIDFTGWGCVNCRNMELAVWADKNVKKLLEDDYVLISLYVDDKLKLPKDQQHISKFSGNKIRTIGNLWSDLQFGKFGQSSQPYYFAIDYNGKPLTGPTAYELNVGEYIKFLKAGLKEFKSRYPKK